MNSIRSLINKATLIWDALNDKKQSVQYKILKDQPYSNYNLVKDIVIINDFVGYPDTRLKKFKHFSYFCTRKLIIKSISKIPANVIMVLSSDNNDPDEIQRLCDLYTPLCSAILITNNIGQDIGAYACGIDYCKKCNINAKFVTLLNTSQFYDWRVVNSFVSTDVPEDGILGLSYGVGPRFSLLKYTHIQSFAIKCNYKYIVKIFDQVVENLMFYNSKYRLISDGEIAISKNAFKFGLTPYVFDGYVIRRIGLVCSLFHYDHRLSIFKNLTPFEKNKIISN